MRMANEQRAAVDRSLKALDAHLQSADIHPGTADLIFACASATLLGRCSTDHVSWICHWHGDPAAVHLTAPHLAWASQQPHNSGRLLAAIDLSHYWRIGAGDQHLLANAADRAAAASGPADRQRNELGRRPHRRGGKR